MRRDNVNLYILMRTDKVKKCCIAKCRILLYFFRKIVINESVYVLKMNSMGS